MGSVSGSRRSGQRVSWQSTTPTSRSGRKRTRNCTRSTGGCTSQSGDTSTTTTHTPYTIRQISSLTHSLRSAKTELFDLDDTWNLLTCVLIDFNYGKPLSKLLAMHIDQWTSYLIKIY